MEDNVAKNPKKKEWKEIESDFLNRYRSEKCISFDYGQTHDFGPEDVDNFLHLVATREGHSPFDTFYLGTYTSEVKELLETCASSITELHLAHWSFRDANFFAEGVPQNLDFSKLKKLDIKLIVDDGETYNVKKFFKFIVEIFRGTPSLQELSCTFPGIWDGEAMEELMRALVTGGDKDNNGFLKFLKCLDISGRFLPTHFLILSALDNLRLERLTLKFCGVLGNTSPKYIKRFLQSQSSSLMALHIEDADSTTKCVITFPQMEMLKTLKISGSCFGGTGMVFEEVNYAKQFPIMENLSLVRVGKGEWTNFINGRQISPCFTLRRLEIHDSEVEDLHLTNSGRMKVKWVFPSLDKFSYK